MCATSAMRRVQCQSRYRQVLFMEGPELHRPEAGRTHIVDVYSWNVEVTQLLTQVIYPKLALVPAAEVVDFRGIQRVSNEPGKARRARKLALATVS